MVASCVVTVYGPGPTGGTGGDASISIRRAQLRGEFFGVSLVLLVLAFQTIEPWAVDCALCGRQWLYK